MKRNSLLFAVTVVGLLSLIAADYAWAKGWCGGGGGGRSAAGQARTKTQWGSPTFATSGDSVTSDNYFEAVKEIKEAARKGQLSLLYVYNSKDDARKIQNFEKSLFENEAVALSLKVYRCLKLDVAKDTVSRDRYGAKLPRLIAFNAKGQQATEVVLKGYKSSTKKVVGALVKGSKGHGDMPLQTFVKKYRAFLNELDKLEDKKETFAKKKARLEKAGARARSKLKKAKAEAARLAKEEEALLAKEKSLLEAVKAYSAGGGSRMVAAAGR